MAQVRNVHGQGRFTGSVVDGEVVATGEVFVDFGEPADQRYVRVRVQPDPDGMIVIAIDGEMCEGWNDAPSLRILINGQEILDTADPGTRVAQPR